MIKNNFLQASFDTLKIPILKLSITAFLLVSCIILALAHFIIFPAFHQRLKDSVESEGVRLASSLVSAFINSSDELPHQINDKFAANMKRAQIDFQLEKIKIFTVDGKVLYSTYNADIGTINTRDYFKKLVAEGGIFSKIIEQFKPLLKPGHDRITAAEVYVPIIIDGKFLGIFEIYFDVTAQQLAVKQNEKFFKIVATITWSLLSVIFLVLIGQAVKVYRKIVGVEEELRKMNEGLEDQLQIKTQKIRMTQKISVIALASLAEYYDSDTGHHLDRIQKYVSALLKEFQIGAKISSQLMDDIVLASVLHDAGKTAVPSEILTKPSKLNKEEFEKVKFHTTVAGEAFEKANKGFKDLFNKDSYLALAKDIALHHHEQWDGNGYPAGLRGTDIPFPARIIAIADVYDALTSKRPYKEAWTHEDAYQTILDDAGKHFDPELVEVFKQCADQFRAICEQYNSPPVPPI